MGTRLGLQVVAADRGVALRASESALAEVRRLERMLSSWRDDTEMARLNSAPPGRPVSLSSRLLQLLREVKRWSEETGGAFDPALGPLIDVWDLRGAGRVPGEAELARARAASGLAALQIDPVAGTAERRNAAVWLSAGAFGKGAALRSAVDALRRAGVEGARLDFGGQVVSIGCGSGGPTEVGVAHPRSRGRAVARLRLCDVSAATSGASERFLTANDRRLGHIVDPRSGTPVSDWGSVTVVSSDPLVADILSTALFVMGPERGLRWLAEREGVGALFLELEGDALVASWNPAMDRWLGPVGGASPEIATRRIRFEADESTAAGVQRGASPGSDAEENR